MSMKKEGKLVGMAVLFLTSQIVLSNNFLPEILTNNKNVEVVGVYSSDVFWKYKVENGKTYKRLYDRKKHKWIGKWILVG